MRGRPGGNIAAAESTLGGQFGSLCRAEREGHINCACHRKHNDVTQGIGERSQVGGSRRGVHHAIPAATLPQGHPGHNSRSGGSMANSTWRSVGAGRRRDTTEAAGEGIFVSVASNLIQPSGDHIPVIVRQISAGRRLCDVSKQGIAGAARREGTCAG